MEATAQTAPAQQAAGKSADHGGVRPRPSLRPLLVLWDVVSVALVIGLHALVDGIEEQSAPGRSIAGLALLASGPLMVYLSGGYERTRRPLGNLPLELGGLAASAGFSTWLAAVVVSATGGRPLISSLTVIWVSIVVAWLIGRVAAAQVVRRRPEPALVVGSGVVARRLVELTLRHPEHGVRVVGVVDTAPLDCGDVPLVGSLDDLPALVDSGRYSRVLIAFSDASRDRDLAAALRLSTPRGVRVDVVPRLYQLMGSATRIEALGDLGLVQVGAPSAGPGRRAVKRAFDIVAAGVVLVVAAPVMAAVAVAVKVTSPGPVLYRQERVGRRGDVFRVMKFRSMRGGLTGADELSAAAQGEPGAAISEVVERLKSDRSRITRVGHFIRRTSLDELPQLINVVKGEMSLVGPRPLRPFEVECLEPWQHARHEMRPGLTGLWQVLGRSDVDWETRMQMDYSYVRHWSLRQDLRVLARTVKVVLRGEGAK